MTEPPRTPYGRIDLPDPLRTKRDRGEWCGPKDLPGSNRGDCCGGGRLLVLTNDGRIQSRIAEPAAKLPKVYWAQVGAAPTSAPCPICVRSMSALCPLMYWAQVGAPP